MNNNPTDELLKNVELIGRKYGIQIGHIKQFSKEATNLIAQHYGLKVKEAIEDIHPYASESNTSTSMQEACLQKAAGVFK